MSDHQEASVARARGARTRVVRNEVGEKTQGQMTQAPGKLPGFSLKEWEASGGV